MIIVIKEVWKDIPGYENYYQVSSLGRVRSQDRFVKCRGNKTRFVKGRILAQTKQHYFRVYLSKENQIKVTTVHSLVLAAFIGVRPEGQESLHGPAGQYINAITNLRYGTHSENEFEKHRDNTSCARKVQRSDGLIFRSITEASKQTGASQSTICQVCRGQRKSTCGYSWRYIDE